MSVDEPGVIGGEAVAGGASSSWEALRVRGKGRVEHGLALDDALLDLIAGPPGEFIEEHSSYIPLCDHADEVGEAREFGAWTCAEYRAVLCWDEHWQAGLSACLTVYPTAESFEEGRWRARGAVLGGSGAGGSPFFRRA